MVLQQYTSHGRSEIDINIMMCDMQRVLFLLQLLPKSNPLETIQAGATQRFYFDTKGGRFSCAQCNKVVLCMLGIHVHVCMFSQHRSKIATASLWTAHSASVGTRMCINLHCNSGLFVDNSGVLLPGERLEFPFVFKSPNAGIFSETWSLQTGPVLNRGRPVTVTLKGVAFQEDLNMHKREQLEVG